MTKAKKLENAIKNLIVNNHDTLENEIQAEENINQYYSKNNVKVVVENIKADNVELERDLRLVNILDLGTTKEQIQGKLELNKRVLEYISNRWL